MIKVTYIGHSGFLAETEHAVLLFDYYKGELPEMDPEKNIFVFVSHIHHDHFNPEIFQLQDRYPGITYMLSSDLSDGEAAGENIRFLGPNEETEISGCRVRTLRSTDEGVAFLVSVDSKTIYHAGDLNWWHWEGETREYNTKMRRAYQSEINKLQGTEIDAAFIPVDPRLGEQYCLGLDCFMKRTVTKAVFPMHFWGNYGIFERLSLEKCTGDYRDRIRKIEREGQVFLLEEGETGQQDWKEKE